jgi:diguanylate cyclase (GGDEF)-like protein
VLARVGGEEFVALLPGEGGAPDQSICGTGKDRLPGVLGPVDAAVTVSAGVSTSIAPVRLDGLLKEADAAMYEAKSAGRNRTVVHL